MLIIIAKISLYVCVQLMRKESLPSQRKEDNNSVPSTYQDVFTLLVCDRSHLSTVV